MHELSVGVFAGEASGDANAAHLVRAMQEMRSGASFWGVGGRQMAEAGVRIEFDSTRWGAMGIWEAVKISFRLHGVFHICQERLALRRPRMIILVDFGAFNCRLARFARHIGIKTFWYFPPRSWSRSPRAAGNLADLSDAVATPFPWSEEILRRAGVNARFVGHPLVDVAHPRRTKEEFCAAYGLDPERPLVVYLPGSRRAELRYIWPGMAGAAAEIGRRVPGAQHVVGLAATLAGAAPSLRAGETPLVVTTAIYDALNACDAAVAKSGTVTLEVACFQKPMVIVYSGSRLAEMEYNLWHRKRIRFIGMPNIIADAPICPELIQKAASPTAIAEWVSPWLLQPETAAPMRRALAAVRAQLGPPGAVRRAAEMAWSVLASSTKS
ncbi:MAG: hypothetical protein HY320_13950 [Armatimonadetes bacterium]|nr:hypothetical protein [Armatimonadota bacterium]